MLACDITVDLTGITEELLRLSPVGAHLDNLHCQLLLLREIIRKKIPDITEFNVFGAITQFCNVINTTL